VKVAIVPLARAVLVPAAVLVLAAVLPLAACSAEKTPEKPRPAHVIVREARAEIEKLADAREAEAETKGERVIWRPRIDTCLEDLDRTLEVIEKRGEFGPPMDEQADELMRASFDLGQAAECDPKLSAVIRPQAMALQKASKLLRRFTVPG
jgi:hypothetical protein